MQSSKRLLVTALLITALVVNAWGGQAFAATAGCALSAPAGSVPGSDPEALSFGAVPSPVPSGISPEAEHQITNLIERTLEALEGAAKHGHPTPGVGPLTTILLHFHDLGCGGIAALLHKARTDLSLRKFDKETDTEIDQAANAARIQQINEILARLAEACDEHRTGGPGPESGPTGDNPPDPPPPAGGKSEADYINIVRKCDPDGRTREMIRWNQRRLDEYLEKYPNSPEFIEPRRAELAQLRGKLCPCLNGILQNAKLAGDKDLEEMVKSIISDYCNPRPSETSAPPQPPDNDGKAGDPAHNPPQVKKALKLGDNPEFKSIQPAPGDGTGKEEGAFLPPAAGAGSEVVSSVVDANQTGPQGVVVGTVDETGKRKFYQAMTDTAGHLPPFSVPVGVTALELFRLFDKNGNPSAPAHCAVGPVSHVPASEPLPTEQIPSRGPAITEASSTIDRGGADRGTITLHTRGTDPVTTRVLIDGKPIETYAASDSSVLARVPADLPLGTHQIGISSVGLKSNVYQADVISTQADALAPMRTGSTQTVRVHVSGVPFQHQAVMHFEVTGAAKLRGGAPSADAPVMNGMATVEIQGVHAGQLVVKYQLHVSIPGYWSLGPKAPAANHLPGN